MHKMEIKIGHDTVRSLLRVDTMYPNPLPEIGEHPYIPPCVKSVAVEDTDFNAFKLIGWTFEEERVERILSQWDLREIFKVTKEFEFSGISITKLSDYAFKLKGWLIA